jgi:hypothetical protein
MITDSDALGYLVSQLEYIEPKVWEKKYTPIIYDELVPVSFEAGEWATSIAVHYMDGVAEGRFIGSAGDDIPFTRIDTGRDQVNVAYGGIGFEYTMEELRQAAHLQRPLDTLLMSKARRGYEEHAQRVAFNGDTDRGLEGLLNHSSVPTAGAASTFAAAANPDAIAAIVNEPISQIFDQSNGVEMADTVLLPIARFNTIATTRIDVAGAIVTVLEYIRQNNSYTAMSGNPLNIRGIPQLTDSMVVYSSNEDVMVMHIPLPLRFVPPQPMNLKVRVPGEYKIAGLEMRYPGAVRYRTGI